MKQTKFLEPEHYAKAPKYPDDRPPTRAEVWARISFIWGNLKPHDELVLRAKFEFVEKYVAWHRKGWRKQPDWKPNEQVFAFAVPKGPFWNGETGNWTREVYRCLGTIQQHRRRTK